MPYMHMRELSHNCCFANGLRKGAGAKCTGKGYFEHLRHLLETKRAEDRRSMPCVRMDQVGEVR